ncbi:phosphotransferase family protein [Ferruginivarius sediminum]|nr:aminoglycoside phosphotransferase family protein [Ferruginivarius sediminum]
MTEETATVVAELVRLGLVGSGVTPRLTPLTGGVASDIWKVETPERCFCVKRALAKLRVAADWRAPVERNAYEVAWFETAGRIVPDAVPRLLGHAPRAGLFAMSYLDPAEYRLWKAELLAGRAKPDDAAAVGDRLVRIHADTADDSGVARRFDSDAIFHAIRLEPYLEATARAHPDVAGALMELSRATARTRRCLVHGDVSPKNIQIGPKGPVFLDAECAWFGDPAFDLAFCLNHLLLKALAVPAARQALSDSFTALATTYLGGVTWEPSAAMEARTARLLPGLFLARVDGKSPVEYLTDEADKSRVRRTARALLRRPATRLADILETWHAELKA